MIALAALSLTVPVEAQVGLPRDLSHELARAGLNPYLELVTRYRTEEPAAAVAEIRRWPRDNVTQAVQSYRRAVEIEPRAQTARVALAHALELSGALDEARTVLEPMLSRTERRGAEDDGWWMYPLGQSPAGAAMLDRFRQRARERD